MFAAGGAPSYRNHHDGGRERRRRAGTTLYDETAWLGAQTMATGVGAGDEEAVQAAIWTMTDDSANLAPPTATLTDSGNTELYRNRMPGHSWQLSDAGL